MLVVIGVKFDLDLGYVVLGCVNGNMCYFFWGDVGDGMVKWQVECLKIIEKSVNWYFVGFFCQVL